MTNRKLSCFHPHVGVAMIVTHGHQVLFGRRTVVPGSFQWQLPGGWLEIGETPEQAARREVREKTGLELIDQRFVEITNNSFSLKII